MARVLVVEDSPDQARMVTGLLEAEDHETQVVPDGKRALAAIALAPPDAVLTDLVMPEMDGLQLVETIAARHPGIPVILMTAYGSGEIAMKALRKGAASYVPKRLIATELLDTLDSVLELASDRQQRERLLASLLETDLRFVLPTDPALISPLADLIGEFVKARCDPADESQLMHASIAIQESLLNAIHHGNLAVSSEIREGSFSAYREEIRRRLAAPRYRGKRILVTARIVDSELTVVVRDEGRGFDVDSVPDPTDGNNLLSVSGRGLYLIGTFMDHVTHNATGNEITMVKRFGSAADDAGPST